jgi:hypothetical protein
MRQLNYCHSAFLPDRQTKIFHCCGLSMNCRPSPQNSVSAVNNCHETVDSLGPRKVQLMNLFPGFRHDRREVNSVTINYVLGGSGTPIVLLHGYPQSLTIWHKIAPELAKKHAVLAPDLRGYGESSKPSAETEDHSFNLLQAHKRIGCDPVSGSTWAWRVPCRRP